MGLRSRGLIALPGFWLVWAVPVPVCMPTTNDLAFCLAATLWMVLSICWSSPRLPRICRVHNYSVAFTQSTTIHHHQHHHHQHHHHDALCRHTPAEHDIQVNFHGRDDNWLEEAGESPTATTSTPTLLCQEGAQEQTALNHAQSLSPGSHTLTHVHSHRCVTTVWPHPAHRRRDPHGVTLVV